MTANGSTGYDWLGQFMEAQAGVAAAALFTTFKLGQIGAAGRYDSELARAMLDDLRTDRVDLMQAATQLDEVLAGLIANIETNLAEK